MNCNYDRCIQKLQSIHQVTKKKKHNSEKIAFNHPSVHPQLRESCFSQIVITLLIFQLTHTHFYVYFRNDIINAKVTK